MPCVSEAELGPFETLREARTAWRAAHRNEVKNGASSGAEGSGHSDRCQGAGGAGETLSLQRPRCCDILSPPGPAGAVKGPGQGPGAREGFPRDTQFPKGRQLSED